MRERSGVDAPRFCQDKHAAQLTPNTTFWRRQRANYLETGGKPRDYIRYHTADTLPKDYLQLQTTM